MLLEQPSQYLAPSKGCADLVFFWVASLAESSAVFAIHLTNVFKMLFPCIQVFLQKKTSVSGQQLVLWLLMDWMFSLFGGSYITPFRWVLLFQNNSAVIHKVAQCVIPMQIPCKFDIYSHISSTISGLDHCTCLLFCSWICMPCQQHKVTSHKSQPQFLTSKRLAHCSTLFYTEHNQ